MKPTTKSCLHYRHDYCFFLSHPDNKGLNCNRECGFYSDYDAYCRQAKADEWENAGDRPHCVTMGSGLGRCYG